MPAVAVRDRYVQPERPPPEVWLHVPQDAFVRSVDGDSEPKEVYRACLGNTEPVCEVSE